MTDEKEKGGAVAWHDRLSAELAKIISDDEIARVHAHANFGSMSPREVVNEGVRKTAVGYHCGSTQLHILRDHGLVTKPSPGSSDCDLTKKGKNYARVLYHMGNPTPQTDTDAREKVVGGLQDCWGALNFILAFYEPGQRHLDTNAWKNAEAGGRRAHKQAGEILAALKTGDV